jgi:hypothetical protein
MCLGSVPGQAVGTVIRPALQQLGLRLAVGLHLFNRDAARMLSDFFPEPCP